jgi:hypothetical protein
MEIKYKLYPYPVLAEYSDDYKAGRFEVNIDLTKEGYDIKVHMLATLTSVSLKRQIQQGNAKYVYHMECAQTGFRQVLITDKIEDSYILSNKLVSGKLQICPFIVATTDIEGYTSDEFHDDYEGQAFSIETGCVMAVGRMITADINKDIDDLANTPSVFSIIRNADASCKQMLVDMSGRKIIIKLPLSDYYSYKSLSNTPQAQSILNSLTVIPALTYVLSELKLLSEEERKENQDYLWYRTIRKSLLTQFECDIESSDFRDQNALELAQKLINDPISDAFQMLTSSFGVAGGDDE